MRLPKAISYITAIDVLKDTYRRESEVYSNHGLDPSISLPFDAGAKLAAEIYKTRIMNMAKFTGAILCRAYGIDAAYRVATRTDFPR